LLKFLSEKIHETFALLDKSVYHIFGEDCARCTLDAVFSSRTARLNTRFSAEIG
jgi:hypothetical protein